MCDGYQLLLFRSRNRDYITALRGNLQLSAPIALFAFNRPDKLADCLNSLSENVGAASSDLFIFVDGPRRKDDITKIDQVTEISRRANGFRSVTVERSEVNLGLAESIRNGIHKVLCDFDSLIVIEDDLVLAETFLEFMNAGLLEYMNNKSFASIQGFQYPINPPMEQLVTIRGADCWGWATWKNRWDLTIFDSNRLLSELRSRNLEYEFDLDGSMPYGGLYPNVRPLSLSLLSPHEAYLIHHMNITATFY